MLNDRGIGNITSLIEYTERLTAVRRHKQRWCGDKNTEKNKSLKKAQNNKIAKCCMLGLIEPVHGRQWLF